MAGLKMRHNADEVKAELARMLVKLDDMGPAMRIFGEIIVASVQENFEVGGRPDPWPPLSPVTKKDRKSSGGPLVVKGFAGGLLGSIHAEADASSVSVGTDKIYGAVMGKGADQGEFGDISITVPAHTRKNGAQVKTHVRNVDLPWGDIPARPYLLIQDDNWDEMAAELTEYLTGDGPDE